ncbi:MAG TPA: flagellar hook-basal body complex protein FliE [Archaeoglobaceae archaeon]|nr:flagellar hook-basal body complex protein FliE [Archaeoglobaceae archaeon]
MKIIAFVGLPLSGKSTAANVARKLGIPVVVMGDVVREEVKKRGLELTDENAGKIASELREEEGMDAIAKRCIPIIKNISGHVVVIDGIRGIAEVECFKKEFGDDFILICIDSNIDKRLERALGRKRSDDISSIEELKQRDERELSWNMDKAMQVCYFTIKNDSGYRKFTNEVEKLLRELSKHVRVEIKTRIHPTEDVEKVIGAVKNLFPDADINIQNEELIAYSKDISRIKELLRKQKILDTARSEFIKSIKNNSITIYLNKQIATVSKVNFIDEDAVLSPLCVTFEVYGIPVERFIDYLAPETRDGKPVVEIDEL